MLFLFQPQACRGETASSTYFSKFYYSNQSICKLYEGFIYKNLCVKRLSDVPKPYYIYITPGHHFLFTNRLKNSCFIFAFTFLIRVRYRGVKKMTCLESMHSLVRVFWYHKYQNVTKTYWRLISWHMVKWGSCLRFTKK